MKTQSSIPAQDFEVNLLRLYWLMRLSMAFIWISTAAVSWFIFPQADSLNWLRNIGITHQTAAIFGAACLFDLLMGLASAIHPTRLLWQLQIIAVSAYTLVIAVALPEFLWHPFGPVTKNLAVLACLFFLVVMERWRNRS